MDLTSFKQRLLAKIKERTLNKAQNSFSKAYDSRKSSVDKADLPKKPEGPNAQASVLMQNGNRNCKSELDKQQSMKFIQSQDYSNSQNIVQSLLENKPIQIGSQADSIYNQVQSNFYLPQKHIAKRQIKNSETNKGQSDLKELLSAAFNKKIQISKQNQFKKRQLPQRSAKKIQISYCQKDFRRVRIKSIAKGEDDQNSDQKKAKKKQPKPIFHYDSQSWGSSSYVSQQSPELSSSKSWNASSSESQQYDPLDERGISARGRKPRQLDQLQLVKKQRKQNKEGSRIRKQPNPYHENIIYCEHTQRTHRAIGGFCNPCYQAFRRYRRIELRKTGVVMKKQQFRLRRQKGDFGYTGYSKQIQIDPKIFTKTESATKRQSSKQPHRKLMQIVNCPHTDYYYGSHGLCRRCIFRYNAYRKKYNDRGQTLSLQYYLNHPNQFQKNKRTIERSKLNQFIRQHPFKLEWVNQIKTKYMNDSSNKTRSQSQLICGHTQMKYYGRGVCFYCYRHYSSWIKDPKGKGYRKNYFKRLNENDADAKIKFQNFGDSNISCDNPQDNNQSNNQFVKLQSGFQQQQQLSSSYQSFSDTNSEGQKVRIRIRKSSKKKQISKWRKRKSRVKSIPQCGHPEKKYAGRGYCVNCFHTYSNKYRSKDQWPSLQQTRKIVQQKRSAKIQQQYKHCGHTEKRYYAKGMCIDCYHQQWKQIMKQRQTPQRKRRQAFNQFRSNYKKKLGIYRKQDYIQYNQNGKPIYKVLCGHPERQHVSKGKCKKCYHNDNRLYYILRLHHPEEYEKVMKEKRQAKQKQQNECWQAFLKHEKDTKVRQQQKRMKLQQQNQLSSSAQNRQMSVKNQISSQLIAKKQQKKKKRSKLSNAKILPSKLEEFNIQIEPSFDKISQENQHETISVENQSLKKLNIEKSGAFLSDSSRWNSSQKQSELFLSGDSRKQDQMVQNRRKNQKTQRQTARNYIKEKKDQSNDILENQNKLLSRNQRKQQQERQEKVLRQFFQRQNQPKQYIFDEEE